MQRWQNNSDRLRPSSTKSSIDSGIEIDRDRDYSSTSDLNSSFLTSTESIPSTRPITPVKHVTFVEPSTFNDRIDHQQSQAFIRFSSDGISERIRPATMKNSENGDYILCRTDRGDFFAFRNPIVPRWVTELVNQIESEQR